MVSRDYILENTSALFLRRGCRVTMDDVAAENGISKRTLYELFDDKRELLLACMEWDWKRAERKMQETVEASENILDALFRMLEARSAEEHLLYEYFLQSLKKVYPDLYPGVMDGLYRAQYEFFRSALDKGISEGVFLKDIVGVPEVKKAVLAFFGHITADLSVDKAVRCSIFLLFLRGLCTRKGIDIIERHIKYNGSKQE